MSIRVHVCACSAFSVAIMVLYRGYLAGIYVHVGAGDLSSFNTIGTNDIQQWHAQDPAFILMPGHSLLLHQTLTSRDI